MFTPARRHLYATITMFSADVSVRIAGHILRQSHAQVPAAECVDADRHRDDVMGA